MCLLNNTVVDVVILYVLLFICSAADPVEEYAEVSTINNVADDSQLEDSADENVPAKKRKRCSGKHASAVEETATSLRTIVQRAPDIQQLRVTRDVKERNRLELEEICAVAERTDGVLSHQTSITLLQAIVVGLMSCGLTEKNVHEFTVHELVNAVTRARKDLSLDRIPVHLECREGELF